jgi:hypothetical protein
MAGTEWNPSLPRVNRCKSLMSRIQTSAERGIRSAEYSNSGFRELFVFTARWTTINDDKVKKMKSHRERKSYLANLVCGSLQKCSSPQPSLHFMAGGSRSVSVPGALRACARTSVRFQKKLAEDGYLSKITNIRRFIR